MKMVEAPRDETMPHLTNFLECIRSRRPEQLVAEVREAAISADLVHLANISYRTGRKLTRAEASTSTRTTRKDPTPKSPSTIMALASYPSKYVGCPRERRAVPLRTGRPWWRREAECGDAGRALPLGGKPMARTVAELPAGSRITDYISLGVIARFVPLAKIREILEQTNRTSVRERDLPAHVVVYYVIALALYTRSSYREVLRCLLEGVKWLMEPGATVKVAGNSGISQARSRLGADPLRKLYDAIVAPIAQKTGEMGNRFHIRIEGTRIKHNMGPVSIKLYDKFGLAWRCRYARCRSR